MTIPSIPNAGSADLPRPLDINEVFRGGGRSVEFLDEINQASVVMLCETGIVPRELGSRIARGIAQVMANEPRAQRSADYLDYEPQLIAVAGPEASRLHSGGSRQDIASTIARMNLRDGLLQECEALIDVRRKLVALAENHKETIIPAYTHGVQAQPTTFAHYLLAFASALARQTERMREAYARINCNPLGAAVLATSSFPLDRKRLAELLGFDGLLENAYDANHLAPIDAFLDLAGDYRSYDPVPCTRPLQVLKLFAEVVDGIVVDKDRALEEVHADYSTTTTTEIADALLQRAQVPFRVGHHFASLLTDYGRSHRLRLSDIPFCEVQRIYRDETKQPLPLSESEFGQVISAYYMVSGRRGVGGPQLAEIDRMLADESARAANDRAWHDEKLRRLADALCELEQRFRAIAAG
ncbi:MAG: hypothetical protein GEV05_04675 [Betaproteobacteria bacterium]|nr:hypothetical protein [Betaproteobacteria bacterium]